MKKLNTLVIACCACISLHAQTITSSVAPGPGDTYSYFSDTLFHPAGASGAGQNWNFSNLSLPPAISTDAYISPAAAPNGSTFTTATTATGSAADTNFLFYQVNSSVFNLVGMVQGTRVINFSNPATYMTFPMSLNGTLSDAYVASFTQVAPFPLNSVTINITGNVTGTADATGNLQLPGGVSYNGLLRIRTRVTQNVAATILGTPNNISSTTTNSWRWFSPGSKFPVFELSIDSVQNFAVPLIGQTASNSVQYATNMRVPASPTGILATANNAAPFVYPNPANGNTRVNFLTEKGEAVWLRVTDMSGAEVFSAMEQGTGGMQTLLLNTESWASGLYLLQVNSERGSHVTKMAIR